MCDCKDNEVIDVNAYVHKALDVYRNPFVETKDITPVDYTPLYGSAGAAGIDLKAAVEGRIRLEGKASVVIPTGLHIQLPQGYFGQLCGRSGLFMKYGIMAQIGIVDDDYRGEIKIGLYNTSNDNFFIEPGMRIGQMVVQKYTKINIMKVNGVHDLKESERGHNGFGSTGLH